MHIARFSITVIVISFFLFSCCAAPSSAASSVVVFVVTAGDGSRAVCGDQCLRCAESPLCNAKQGRHVGQERAVREWLSYVVEFLVAAVVNSDSGFPSQGESEEK